MSFLEKLNDAVKFLLNWKLIIVIAAIFLIAAAVYYRKYIVPKITKKFVENREFVPTPTKEIPQVTLKYFYTNWCPMSKIAGPEIEALESEIVDGMFQNIKLRIDKIDCDAEAHKEETECHKIEGYPTIKLNWPNADGEPRWYEYDAKPNKDTLIKFIKAVTSSSN
jgi:hypothetical protein